MERKVGRTMSGRRVFTIVVVALLVIAVLAVGGCALYRLGFARGVSAVAGVPEAGRFYQQFGAPFMPGFDGGGMHEFGRSGGQLFRSHMPFMGFGLGGWLFGLVVLVGVVALVVIAINGLRTQRPVESPPAPSQIAEAPAAQARTRTPRGARKAR